MTKLLFVTVLLSIAIATTAFAEPRTFREAKKAMNKVYYDQQTTFYCGCDYQARPKANGRGKQLQPDWKSCGFSPRKQAKRAGRIEWEHVMPAHHFGQHLSCWREGGRKSCDKDPVFQQAEGDMHNLVPAIGELPVKAFSRHYLAAL